MRAAGFAGCEGKIGGLWRRPGAAMRSYLGASRFNIFCAVDRGNNEWDIPHVHLWYINIAIPPIVCDGTLQYVGPGPRHRHKRQLLLLSATRTSSCNIRNCGVTLRTCATAHALPWTVS